MGGGEGGLDWGKWGGEEEEEERRTFLVLVSKANTDFAERFVSDMGLAVSLNLRK